MSDTTLRFKPVTPLKILVSDNSQTVGLAFSIEEKDQESNILHTPIEVLLTAYEALQLHVALQEIVRTFGLSDLKAPVQINKYS